MLQVICVSLIYLNIHLYTDFSLTGNLNYTEILPLENILYYKDAQKCCYNPCPIEYPQSTKPGLKAMQVAS